MSSSASWRIQGTQAKDRPGGYKAIRDSCALWDLGNCAEVISVQNCGWFILQCPWVPCTIGDQELKGHANACNSCESSSIIVVALRLWLANVKMLAPCDDTSWVPSKLRTHGPVLTVCQNRTADAQKVQHFSFSRGPMDWRKRLEDLKMWMLAIALKHCHCTWHQNVRSATLDSWLFTLHHRIWIFNWLIYGWWRVLMNHCLQVELVTHTRYQGQC